MQHLIPVYAFPPTESIRENGPPFSARPIKHWRKQFQRSLGSGSRISVGMPADRPGGTMPVANGYTQCQTCNGAASVIEGNPTFGYVIDGNIIEHTNPTPNCTCNERIKLQTQLLANNFINKAEYNESRCFTYEQNIRPNQCINIKRCAPAPAIYKPNNMQYAQQGGVSSGSRLARLKYNTLNKNGGEYVSAQGAVNANSGAFQLEPSPAYFNKYKPQPCVNTHKTGAKTSCSKTYSISMNE
jgi:hypothetical protein